MTAILFYVFSAILVVAALRVITARSPVTAAMHLVLSFFTAAMLWVLLKAEFLGILLVLVYVGAVMVLFLFVVMMLDINVDKIREGFRSYLPLGFTVGIVMVAEMAFVLGRAYWDPAVGPAVVPDDFNNTREIGIAMYTEYVYAVEIAAVLLLVGMIAAIALTLRHRVDLKRNDPGKQIRVRREDRIKLVDMPAAPRASATPAEPAPTESTGGKA